MNREPGTAKRLLFLLPLVFAGLILGSHPGFASEDQPLLRDLAAPSAPEHRSWMQEVSRFDRLVTRMVLTPGIGSGNRRVVCLAAGYQIGLGRLNGRVQALAWHEVTGRVLDISVGPVQLEKGKLPLVVVTQKRRDVSSTYYLYDLVERALVRVWSYRHVWIYRRGSGWMGQPIGLSDPLRNPPSPVQVGAGGWDWISESGDPIPGNTLPVALWHQGTRLYRLNASGRLEYFERGRRLAQSNQRFGGSPLQVAPRRGKDEVQLHPGLVVLRPGTARESVLVARNNEKGWELFSPRRKFSHLRLYLMERQGSNFEVVRESDRIPGRLTVLTGDASRGWMVITPPGQEESVLYRIESIPPKGL